MPDIIGRVFTGKVTGITDFGAFVKLPGGKTGLVHISEISSEYVKDIKDHLQQNQIIRVKVLSIDDRGKIGLSIKKAAAEAGAAAGATAAGMAAGAGVADVGMTALAAEAGMTAVVPETAASGRDRGQATLQEVIQKTTQDVNKVTSLEAEAVIAANVTAGDVAGEAAGARAGAVAPSPATAPLMALEITSRNANKTVIAQARMPINRKQGKPADIFWNSREQATGLSFEERLSKYMKDSNEKLNDLKKNFEDET